MSNAYVKTKKNTIKNTLIKLSMPSVPKNIYSKFKKIDNKKAEIIEKSLMLNYFADCTPGYLDTEIGKEDLQAHLFNRLELNRKLYIPWLNNSKNLKLANVLEIGCGTGCSTIALAEQGATVFAIDIDEKAILVAKDRCKCFDLSANFFVGNAQEIHNIFNNKKFDFIIFYASLEHMVHNERITSLNSAWDLLVEGGLLCIVETPNRLWHFDHHTARMPFFHWLPDELSFEFSKYSNRKNFNDIFSNYDDESRIKFLRLGRGVSYHEFTLAIKPAEQLDVVSYLAKYKRDKSFLSKIKWLFSDDMKYQKILSKTNSNISRAFFEVDLNIIIKKN